MNYEIINLDTYYRKDVFKHFSQDCKCSLSLTSRIDVTELKEYSDKTKTKFYLNFLYLLCKVLNSRRDYRMAYLWKEEKLICFDQINPTHYLFHEDTETCSPIYSTYNEDYQTFYQMALEDMEKGKMINEYSLDAENHPNWFDASYISWLSYDSLNLELPDGYLYFQPIINWGRYRQENDRLMMPVTVRMNHAIADGYLVSQVFILLEKEIKAFCQN